MNNEILLRLQQVPNFGVRSIYTLFETINMDDFMLYKAPELHALGWNETQINKWLNPNEAIIEQTLQWAEKEGNILINYEDPNYPYLLKQICDPPLLLFINGDINSLSHPQVAMVGSRYCSEYGEYWAKYFATELSLAGFTVTSGLALGIDGYSHQAVVNIGGQTIAVLGSGLGEIYPKKHRKLANQILENKGAIISEFIPSQPPLAQNFPRRNRIISGLSLGTLIVEATDKSGSLITARYALEQNRDVFAIPGNIQNEFSHGCHKIIKQGAMLVEDVKDILENLNIYHAPSPFLQTPKQHLTSSKKSIKQPKKISVEPQYPELYANIGHIPISLDELCEKTTLTVDTLLIQLLGLELQDLIINENGLYRRR